MNESKKLKGLTIVILALGGLLTLACVVIILTGKDDLASLFSTFGGYIMGMGAAHQTAQAAADRSPNYNPPPTAGSLLPPPV